MPIESSQVMMQSGMLGMGVLFSTSIRGIIINMLILFLFLVLSHVFLLTSSCMVFSCTSTDGLLRTHDFLLLNATDIQWDTRPRIQLQLLPPKTSYHAFRLVVEGRNEVGR